jgi:Xaa-Pro aminopeptidase
LSELSCAKYLDDLRLQEDLCFDLSFTTISAVDENAAMLHYAPSEENNAPLKEDSKLLLVDSGGQYYGGTTDTTRTFLINPNVDEEVKHDYTLTLKSQIALTTTIFEKGCSGRSIDIKARQIMWDEGLDYKCGTGHGVGYISCVHEGPVGFRYYVRPGVEDGYPIQLGQIITVEPGVYKPHKHGIRLENNLLVVPACETSDGIFYRFETITYCPYDRRGINLDELTEKEISWVDEYHKQCYELLSPLCKEDENCPLCNTKFINNDKILLKFTRTAYSSHNKVTSQIYIPSYKF